MKDLPITMEPDGWLEKTGGYAKDMTFLDAAAIAVLQGICSHPEMMRAISDGASGPSAEIGKGCYAIARALLKAKKNEL